MTRTIYRSGIAYARLHENGQIERLDGHAGPSENWRVTGAVTRNNFGYVTARWTLDEILSGESIPWRFKNGRQRTFLRDYDHGTGREWGHPAHHVA